MTKDEFTRQVAAEAGLSHEEANRAVDAVLGGIADSLRQGQEVTFTGFGKFAVKERSARMGINPQSGERIQIAATKVPSFKPGAKLKGLMASLPGEGGEKF